MVSRATKLRFRRGFRHRQQQVEKAALFAEYEFEKKVIGKLGKFRAVRKFVASWVLLVMALIAIISAQTLGLSQYYLKQGAVSGGVYNEGMVGTFSNANPIYAVGAVDTSVSRLLFAGLFRYDDQNALVGDLASGYTVDESGRTYTVQLKNNLTWHDGTRLTAKDVAFTFAVIQNPDARSPLFGSWQGIQVTAPAERTVVFTLPNALAAFPYSLTTGIIPAHILGSVAPQSLRAHSFNTAMPIGAGPFSWSALQLGDASTPNEASAILSFKAFEEYNGGRPRLDGFVLHTYDASAKLLAAYNRRTVEAAAGLQEIPQEVRLDRSNHVYEFPTTAAVMVFFKTSEGLLADLAIRKALVLAANKPALLTQLGQFVQPVHGPLLTGQLGYDSSQEQPKYNRAEAEKALQDAGWVRGSDGIRGKDNQKLSFQLLAEDTSANRTLLAELKTQWRAIGVEMQPSWQQNSADMQGAVETHGYTSLLYGIGIGPDPDVYVYWDSTQADPRSASRLNFSEYKSAAADTALESARTRSDDAVRVTKYQAFLKAWQADYPALALYQPNALYLTRGGAIDGLVEHELNADADRYYSVTAWAVKRGYIPK